MNTQIYEQASDWIVRHRDGELSHQDKSAFDQWLRESPQHVSAYIEMSSVWEGVSSLDPAANPDAATLIARARVEDNVVSLDVAAMPPLPATHASPAPARRSTHVWYGLAASLLLVLAAGWLFVERNTYATGIGEHRSILLSDGTSVDLNSRSKLKVRYSDNERGIELIEGQALFRVAKNPTRPFIVRADGTRVHAVGTQFDVYRKPHGTVVTVIEGRVAVAERAARNEPGSAEITLVAGEQLTLALAQSEPAVAVAPRPTAANVDAATAWTRRSLLFDAAKLSEVAEEFNRYNRKPLRLQNESVAGVRISGTFSATDPSVLLRFLRMQPELQVEETERDIRISQRAQ